MSEIWFTSDTHFGHQQEFLYGPRQCSTLQEMEEKIVEHWNQFVRPTDIVYHLGDISMGVPQNFEFINTLNILSRLNGQIHWIRGNHDSDNKVQTICKAFHNITLPIWSDLLVVSKHKFFLCHYPTLTANFDDKHFSQHVISLHGHTHQTKNWLFADNPFVYHVGLDSHDCYPVHIETVLGDIRSRWNSLGMLNITPTGIYNEYP